MQTTRTGTKSQKWRSPGGLSVGRERVENAGKGTGNKKPKWQVQNRQGDVKNSIGNREPKELVCTTQGHEKSGGIAGGNVGTWWRGTKGESWDNCNSIINKIHFFKKEKV